MPTDDLKTIDIMRVENAKGNVVLTISDDLDWSESTGHQQILQRKINRYLAFAESGQLLRHRPKAAGRKTVIEVICKFEPDSSAGLFFDRLRMALHEAGLEFQQTILGASR